MGGLYIHEHYVKAEDFNNVIISDMITFISSHEMELTKNLKGINFQLGYHFVNVFSELSPANFNNLEEIVSKTKFINYPGHMPKLKLINKRKFEWKRGL